MTSVLLVHGTGVRKPAYDVLYRNVGDRMRQDIPSARLYPCLWGDTLGAKLHFGGKSIPSYDTTRSVGTIGDDDADIVLWSILHQDPLYELRLVGQRSATSEERALGALPPGEQVAEAVRDLSPAGALADALAAAHLHSSFLAAREVVVASDAFVDAVDAVGAEDVAMFRAVVARAVVAEAIRISDDAGDGDDISAAWSVDGTLRDAVVDAVIDALGGTERSIGGWVRGSVTGLASWYATRKIKRERGVISDAAHPAAGDILLYQARGQAIRDFIRAAVDALPSPVVIIAHSLGGIASVDALIEQPMPKVALVVTVGSQAALLYELGALSRLATTERLPGTFPRWVNIYDLKDFLSYVGADVFGTDRVRDVVVDNRESFPRSHSAYWTNAALWRVLSDEIGAVASNVRPA